LKPKQLHCLGFFISGMVFHSAPVAYTFAFDALCAQPERAIAILKNTS
jgi:hypothetical protein